MFQFRRFPTYAYFIQRTLTEYCSAGFPHSEICGSKLMCSSPQLIAACHVLRRLLMPRHSPCALSSLTSSAVPFQVPPGPGSQELCRLQIRFIVVCVTLLISKKSTNFTLLPLCCLLAISCLLHCSVFKVQVSDPSSRSDRNARSLDQTLRFDLVVEVTGLEPVTPCLQRRCSTS